MLSWPYAKFAAMNWIKSLSVSNFLASFSNICLSFRELKFSYEYLILPLFSKPVYMTNIDLTDDEDDDDEEELYRGAPERLVKHMDSGKIVGTHKHGVGYTPNKHGIRLGHSSHPTSIPNFTKFDDEDDMYSINEGVNVVPKGKSDLIQVLINKINYMEKNNEFNAMDVAQTIYNDCANFMNKTDIFSDKTKYGEDVSQPPAEFAKREQVPESSIEKTETDSTETQY